MDHPRYVRDNDVILSVQSSKLREVGELRWDGSRKPIRVEDPTRATGDETKRQNSNPVKILEQ